MPKLSEIAMWFGIEMAVLDGEITTVSAIESAGPESLVFATDSRTLEQALRSKAGGILVSQVIASATAGEDIRVLRVPEAKLAFAVAAGRLKKTGYRAWVHPSAVIESDVVLGERTHVGPGALVEAGVKIGADCEIRANVVVHSGTTVGSRVIVQSGAILGSAGFGYVRDSATGKYVAFPQQGTLEIGDDVEIGANSTIDRGALGETRIGRGTKIDNLVHIAHNCCLGEDVVIAAQTGISGSTVIGDGAVIGGQVGVGDHALIGEGVILGSGSGILSGKKLSGPGQVFWGTPAQPLKAYLRDLARFRRS